MALKIKGVTKYSSIKWLQSLQDNDYKVEIQGKWQEYCPIEVDAMLYEKLIIREEKRASKQLRDFDKYDSLIPKMGNKIFPPIIKTMTLKEALIELGQTFAPITF